MPLLSKAKLPESLLDSPQGYIPEQRLWLFIDVAANALNMKNFGLEVAKWLDINNLGSFISALKVCPTLFTTLTAFCENVKQESSGASFWISTDDDYLWFHRGGVEGINFAAKQVEDYTLMLMIKVMRIQLGENWMPSIIHLKAKDSGALVEDPEFSNVKFCCSQKNTEIPVALKDISLSIGTHLNLKFNQEYGNKDFVERLLKALSLYSNSETINIEDAAAIVGMSVRTIQRRLKECSVSYQQLQDRLKFQRCIQLMQESPSLTEVAFQLGYSDSAHFSRAFQRWTGVSPSRYRRVFLNDSPLKLPVRADSLSLEDS